MSDTSIIEIKDLGFQWSTNNPFLFCVHHKDDFPRGNGKMGPESSLLEGRRLGNDFTLKDGWRMYHGMEIPGFPQHPHRGFETITIVLEGLVDHADSMGAAGRYGHGDVQWMTAGRGIQHCEMFPLLNENRENHLELFQIWLNLPAKDKFVEPSYKMLWKEDIPIVSLSDQAGKSTEITIIAGPIGDALAPAPTPDSWAAKAENEVAIWLIKMEAGAEWKIPSGSENILRSLYFYRGSKIKVAGREVPAYKAIDIIPDHDVLLENGPKTSYLLLLQGRPINEPVVQYGPFVMNTQAEIQQAFEDYRRTGFGTWPWPEAAVVHDRDMGRFAK